MITVRSSEFAKNFGRYREAAQREPVAVTAHERITGYFVSGPEYEAFLRLRENMRKVVGVEDLSDETIEKLKSAQMDKRHDSLDHLLDD